MRQRRDDKHDRYDDDARADIDQSIVIHCLSRRIRRGFQVRFCF